jgi:hypothetical protein
MKKMFLLYDGFQQFTRAVRMLCPFLSASEKAERYDDRSRVMAGMYGMWKISHEKLITNKKIRINMKKIRIGFLIAIAITGLSIENALTGHGIKGNMSLNPAVLATGSNSGSSTSSWPGEGITGTTGTEEMEYLYEIKVIPGEEDEGDSFMEDGKLCIITTSTAKVECPDGGDDECIPGTLTQEVKCCFTPD